MAELVIRYQKKANFAKVCDVITNGENSTYNIFELN